MLGERTEIAKLLRCEHLDKIFLSRALAIRLDLIFDLEQLWRTQAPIITAEEQKARFDGGREFQRADADRDVRGFARKFHAEEGTWDLVGNDPSSQQ